MNAIPSPWVKSSYSGNGGDNCVEWQPSAISSGAVPVRDSKDTTLPALTVPTTAWAAFVQHLKA
ncbi:DUF397 domain-containing protein [Streptomyces bohaiensis]|uniref:DUF397 domain-containing protein n=1 Tax=Streptomyces bohaiensis TaxID=1431344 RepID=A0ABX1C9X1_9ACTN|nr:DUF397 domain-containing protein [Streptomyces bohaiensis]NJQ14157.1 DUF397 domain-containing protein [Streptomyces bohaiensis]